MVALYVSIIILVVNVCLWVFFFIQHKKRFSAEGILEETKDNLNNILKVFQTEIDKDLSTILGYRDAVKSLLEQLDSKIEEAKNRILQVEEENTKKQNEKAILEKLSTENSKKEKKQTLEQKKLSAYSDSAVLPQKEEPLLETENVEVPKKEKSTKKATAKKKPTTVNTEETQQPQVAVVEENLQNPELAFTEPAQMVLESVVEQEKENDSIEVVSKINIEDDVVVEVDESLYKIPQPEVMQPEIKFSNKPIKQTLSVREQIIELYDRNFSAEIIAERLKLPLGEVQLVINLRSPK